MPVRCIPADIFQILEFDKILDHLRAYCHGPAAEKLSARIIPETHHGKILEELQRAHEAQRILEHGGTYLTSRYESLEEILKRLSVQDFVLDVEEILSIRRILERVSEIRTFFNSERSATYPGLGSVAKQLNNPSLLLKAIGKIMDQEGNILPDASKALIRITQDIRHAQHQGDIVFQQLIRQYVTKGWLADTQESVRNERRVLTAKAEYKRQIRGILHDQSASGKTVLIEPEEMIGLNNDVFDLRAAYQAEVRRLLRMLCDFLREHIDVLGNDEIVVAEMDLHLAKGHLGKAMHAQVPVLEDAPRLGILAGYHPLLLLRNTGTGKRTVPFDLDLRAPNRILLLSGPNAGGKSILMKAVGLLQLMVQSGIPVPVSPDAVFGIFDQISASLGDHQSIENDLSTYSSKLGEMRDCLEHAGDRSLVLIDEFGAGTDPRLGGAIAEGILEALCSRHVFGVITTHYSELKVYAYRKRGIVNGAMVFDKAQMAPTYELRIGKPGSSFTFEMARLSGLPVDVLDYAAQKSQGQNLRAMEELLADLEHQRARLDHALKLAEQRNQQLDQLVQSYERVQNDLTAQRYRLRLEQKEKDYAHLSRIHQELEKTVRTLRAEKDMASAQEKVREVRSLQSQAQEEIKALNDTLNTQFPRSKLPLKEGDNVRIYNGTQTGRIERIQKNIATVIMGQMRIDIPLGDLVPTGEPLDIRSERSVRTDTEVQEHFDPRLDLRGMRPGEARDLLERFMDMALITNAGVVQIIHGKGTGALRKMVMEKLREYPVKNILQSTDQHGGSGMTEVTL